MPTSCPHHRVQKTHYLNNLKNLQPSADLNKVYQDLGRSEGVNRLVKRVYQYNVLDIRISHFFNIEMINRFESMFGSFLVGLLGGKPYNRKAMIKSHQTKVNLNDDHFNAFLENVFMALKHEKVSQSAVTVLMDLIEDTREDVTGRTDPNSIPVLPPEKLPVTETLQVSDELPDHPSGCQCVIQ